jgi:hypothetical protein
MGIRLKKDFLLLIVVLMATLQFLWSINSWAESDQAGEYQVKTAYLYNFAKYVDWPTNSSDGHPSAITICVLGKSPFGDALNSIAGKMIKGRRVSILHITRIEEQQECDILFVCASEKTRLGQILASVASRPILTVSGIKHFVDSGGMIGFSIVNDKIRFEINQRSVHRSGLRISAQLLKLATKVTD